jgi:regulator of sirC expression with transglutaminase-like and TPR domain
MVATPETPLRLHTFDRTNAPLGGPLEALLTINREINLDLGDDGPLLRSARFMSYELLSLCSDLPPQNRLETLNEFFFERKRFRFADGPFLIQEILEQRLGCGIALALFYIHLAEEIGLQFQLVHWPLHSVLKWDCDGRCRFVDLEQNGKLLNEDELLSIVNKHKDQVCALSLDQALIQYLTYMAMAYRQSENRPYLHRVLDLAIQLEPENTRFLAERAILRRDLGLIKESLHDFKRYFSFTELHQASPEIVSVYESVKLLSN